MTTYPGQRPTAPPPGWYVNDNGARQWWDGRAWGPLAPLATPAPVPNPLLMRKPRNPLGTWSIAVACGSLLLLLIPRAGSFVAALGAATALVLAIVGLAQARSRRVGTSVVSLVISAFVVVISLAVMGMPAMVASTSQISPAHQASAIPSAPVEAKPPQQTAEQQRDTQMENQGFRVWQSGETWVKAADPGSFTCDYGTRCIWYSIVSYSGCSAGFYVKGDILNENGVAIDWTNEITASVAATETVAFQLRTMTDGSKFRLTEISCML